MSKPSTHHYTIQMASQSEQEGGYWLLNVVLDRLDRLNKQGGGKFPPPSPEIELGDSLQFENSEHSLYLFQQTHTEQQITLQLLSRHPLPTPQPKRLNRHIAASANQAILETVQHTPNLLLLGSELQQAKLFYLAKYRTHQPHFQTLALLHSDSDFPFKPKPSLLMTPHLPPEAIGTSQLLEDWKIPNRLASPQGLAGCFDGTLEALFAYWLTQKNLTIQTNESWQMIICAPSERQKKCLAISQSYEWMTTQAL